MSNITAFGGVVGAIVKIAVDPAKKQLERNHKVLSVFKKLGISALELRSCT